MAVAMSSEAARNAMPRDANVITPAIANAPTVWPLGNELALGNT